jgi:hypothetical protein
MTVSGSQTILAGNAARFMMTMTISITTPANVDDIGATTTAMIYEATNLETMMMI